MIFQHTWEKVLRGEKTATSRIVKPAHEDFPMMYAVGQMNSIGGANMEPGEGIYAVTDHNTNRTIYAVGQDYAVQPGRGQKAVARIQITSIARYDVRAITAKQAQQEGFKDVNAFLGVWCKMHDPTFHARWSGEILYRGSKRGDMLEALNRRQDNKYDAWFLTFTLLEGQS